MVWRWDNQDPFGANAPDDNPSALGTFTFNPRFPGQYFDKETNTHYNYFRDYDPALGRYIESDPIGLTGGSLSTYLYVNSNPLLFKDLAGLKLPKGAEVVIDPLIDLLKEKGIIKLSPAEKVGKECGETMCRIPNTGGPADRFFQENVRDFCRRSLSVFQLDNVIDVLLDCEKICKAAVKKCHPGSFGQLQEPQVCQAQQ